jgi:hypothetical protein
MAVLSEAPSFSLSALSTSDSRTLQEKLYQFCAAGDIPIAIDSRRLGPLWSPRLAHFFNAADT